MITLRKTIDSALLWLLLAVCILALCLAPPAAARANHNHPLWAAGSLAADLPEILIPKPPPPPPPARA